MEGITTYFKSMANLGHGDLQIPGTLTYVPELQARVPCQLLENILDSKIIIPHTYHKQMSTRLCVSVPNKEYYGSYRPEGILFETGQQPDYCCPVDLLALTNAESTNSSNYNGEFLEYSEKMIFKTLSEMYETWGGIFKYPEKALEQLNAVREIAGFKPILNPYYYNECGFFSPVSIKPVGLVGSSNEINKLAEKYYLPVYNDVKEFIDVSQDWFKRIFHGWKRRK